MKQQTAFESPSSHVFRGGPSESGLGVRVSSRLTAKSRCCYSSNKQLLGVTIACGGPEPGWIGRAWICPVSSFGTPRLDDGGLRGAAIPSEAESRIAVQCHFAMDRRRMKGAHKEQQGPEYVWTHTKLQLFTSRGALFCTKCVELWPLVLCTSCPAGTACRYLVPLWCFCAST